jgi:predicted metalloprotease with PDZ domain
MGDFVLSDSLSFNDALKNFKPKDKTKIVFERFGEQKETEITFMSDPSYSISVFEANDLTPTEAQKANRKAWLSTKN